MFEKGFAKYGRAVSDERERHWLYKKYRTKTIVSFVFYVLCIAVVVLILALSDFMEEEWAVLLIMALIFTWIGFSIATACLCLSFRKMYHYILTRPASSDEIPQITSYRQKTVAEKKSAFKRLGWAWILFGLSLVGFIVCIVMEVIENPDSEAYGIWGNTGVWLLLIGLVVILLSNAFYYLFNQQKGKTVEQQTAEEAKVIDRIQGRKQQYDLQSDPNFQSFKYLFPNRELYAEAETFKKKYQKTLASGFIVVSLLSIVIVLVLVSLTPLIGYVLPIVFTLCFGLLFLALLPRIIKLNALEKKQKTELETNPAYAKNYEWYQLYDNFSKFKGKIYIIFVVVGIVLSWILAIIYPEEGWSFTGLIPIVIGLAINNKLVKNLRQQAILIEKEIDRVNLKLHDVSFVFKEGDADESMRIIYDKDGLSYEKNQTAPITLYLGESYICLEVEPADGKVVNLTLMKMYLEEINEKTISVPKTIQTGTLYAEIGTLEDGTCWRINFTGSDYYDPVRKSYLVGEIDDQQPCFKIFNNGYVQLSKEGMLTGIIITEIEAI